MIRIGNHINQQDKLVKQFKSFLNCYEVVLSALHGGPFAVGICADAIAFLEVYSWSRTTWAFTFCLVQARQVINALVSQTSSPEKLAQVEKKYA